MENSISEKWEAWGHSSLPHKGEAEIETTVSKRRYDFQLFEMDFLTLSVSLWNIINLRGRSTGED